MPADRSHRAKQTQRPFVSVTAQRIDELQRVGAGIATAVAAYDIAGVADPYIGCPKQ
jgi:hypothetical protein